MSLRRKLILRALAILILGGVIGWWLCLPPAEERAAIAIARNAANRSSWWATYKVHRTDDGGWSVSIQDWPRAPGAFTIVIIDRDGSVQEIRGGK
jgi:hypothetical protein